MPWIRQLITGLLLQWPWFSHSTVHVGFVVDVLTLGRNFVKVCQLSAVSIFPAVLQTCLFIHHQCCMIVRVDRLVK
jgi:hypothetical protein